MLVLQGVSTPRVPLRVPELPATLFVSAVLVSQEEALTSLVLLGVPVHQVPRGLPGLPVSDNVCLYSISSCEMFVSNLSGSVFPFKIKAIHSRFCITFNVISFERYFLFIISTTL